MRFVDATHGMFEGIILNCKTNEMAARAQKLESCFAINLNSLQDRWCSAKRKQGASGVRGADFCVPSA